jgi:predicted AlkP superfamily pyrophosphatase or phosphodiesterase
MIALAVAALLACSGTDPDRTPERVPGAASRLHWFIPDGLRADPVTFDVFRWAEEGRMPHLKALMARGSYGYSIPAFPSHTPANFATLLTGATPRVHGVADGPMHVEGRPLARPSVGGFSSAARKVPAVWSLLEGAGKRVFLLSVPGSTPPELGPGGITVRGRWGGWGPELPAITFESESATRQAAMARSARLFLVGEPLTHFVAATRPGAWSVLPVSDQPPLEIDLAAAGVPLFGLLVDPPGDGHAGYTRLKLSRDRTVYLDDLGQGEWTEWDSVTVHWKDVSFKSNQRVEVIRLGDDGFFRVRVLFDGLNRLVAEPPEVADALRADVGPMVDYPDSYPAQLVYYPEDKAAFLSEATQSLAWHADAARAIQSRYDPDVFIHAVYTPNQLLTSRWWMGLVDPTSRHYADATDAERAAAWADVSRMYQQVDEILGRATFAAAWAPDTLLVLSSDHGAIPLDRWVRLNNLFAERGWLAVVPDPETGQPSVDWEHSRVVFLNTYHVYIDPEGLGGDWHRASGPAYEALRTEVGTALLALRDGDLTPVAAATPWEGVGTLERLPADRVGDLVLTSRAGYAWNEEITEDRAVFGDPLVAGYKQAVSPETTPGLWTPFVIVGPGIRAGHRIETPIHAIDQLPTILLAMGQAIPDLVEGHAVAEVFVAP